jgi:hypothetical protein
MPSAKVASDRPAFISSLCSISVQASRLRFPAEGSHFYPFRDSSRAEWALSWGLLSHMAERKVSFGTWRISAMSLEPKRVAVCRFLPVGGAASS